jgi:hypothetical protein
MFLSRVIAKDQMNLSIRLCLSLCVLAATALAERPARAADPTTSDCLAASESSLALRNQHKLRDSRAQLLICAAASCPADVRQECARRVSDVNAAIPTIVFEARDSAGNDLVAVKVTMDRQPIADRLEGTALSIDPGAHTFSFETAGQAAIQKQFVIREGEKDRRERLVFGAASVATVPAPAPAPASILASSPGTPPPSDGASHGLGTQRILAIVAAGVGVVGLGVGIGYGVSSRSKHDSASKVCPNPQCPDGNGVDLWNQAISAGNISTAAFIVGAAGLAGGATLWFTAPHRAGGAAETAGTQVGLGPGMLQMKGVW